MYRNDSTRDFGFTAPARQCATRAAMHTALLILQPPTGTQSNCGLRCDPISLFSSFDQQGKVKISLSVTEQSRTKKDRDPAVVKPSLVIPDLKVRLPLR